MNFRTLTLFALFSTPCFSAQAAITIPLTVNLSETVTVTGTPRIAVDVGGTTRYATYTSGTGTNTLTFTLSPQAGDVDLDGVTVSSPIDLNGGTIKDAKGNNASLTFTPPSTPNVKVNYPSFGMDFAYDPDGRYTLNGTVYNDLTSFLAATGGTFTRASIATYYDSTGTLKNATANTPRFDYDPNTHTANGILIEESRTNLQIYSNSFSNWVNNGGLATITDNVATSPEGILNASTISSTAGGAGVYRNSTTVNGASYTQSIYLKYLSGSSTTIRFGNDSNNRYITINPLSMTVSNAGASVGKYSVSNIGNGWYRFTLTWTSISTSEPTVLYNMVGLPLNIAVYGAQLEQGIFATSYIPTTTATVTRAVDNLTIPTGSWFNASAGTLFGEAKSYDSIAVTSVGASPTVASINTSVSSNIARLGRYISTPSTGFFQSGVAGLTVTNMGTWANASSQKTAGNYDASGFSSILGTNPIVASASGSLSGTISNIKIGQYAGSGYWSSTISKVKYYPTRVSDTQLQLLTQ